MFDPILASKNIKDEFISYISTSFHIADQTYADQLIKELNKENVISKGPYLDITDSFESGKSIREMMSTGEMSILFEELEKDTCETEKEIKLERKLYKHQQKAVEKINTGKNLVVTTGTGSGKTECFILPILNHLLKEKENGTLNNGVRAILIYPMNALANDQMKRLRKILKEYPDITFGVYNSSTKYEDKEGIAEYGKIFKDDEGKALKPLPNESISRKSMQENPPHILVTNYAMLEYMMLRPKDDLVFSGAKLRFLVLDEAHIYKGTTGIETSLLLRRLKARISNPSLVHHILTSATLGGKEADKDIIHFANSLCNAHFDTDDIIRSKTVIPELPSVSKEIPFALFNELSHPDTSMNEILKKYNIEFDSSKTKEEILYDICLSSRIYKVLREKANKPMTVHELAEEMRNYIPLEDNDLTNFINVASRAEKNKTTLLKARYHMFLRALEGAYITLDAKKELFLKRIDYTEYENDQTKVFEASVCDDCGRIGVAGRIFGSKLIMSSNRFDNDTDVYLLRNQDEQFEIDDDEEEFNIGKNDYYLCSKCGEIHHDSEKSEFSCGHGEENLVRVIKADKKGVREQSKCPCCNFGNMKTFYLGYDAATSVLGTELFEQLPEIEEKLEIKKVEIKPTKNLFAVKASKPKVQTIQRPRQFLSFSDSRSEAAYFASYMTNYYKEFLRRRGIWHVIEKNKENIIRQPWDIKTLVSELTSYFDYNRSFASPEDTGSENLTAESKRQAWIAVLNEIVNSRRSTSLVSLGILDFEYKGNDISVMESVAENLGKNPKDVKALFDLIVMDIVHTGAIEGEDCNLTNDERDYIYYGAKPRRFVRCKESESDRKKDFITGFIPRVRESGKSYKNSRVTRIIETLDFDENDSKELLENYWDGILNNNEFSLTYDGKEGYYFSTDKFLVVAGDDLTKPLYICKKCGKKTMTNCKDKCISTKCDGALKKITRDNIINGNHFARLYSEKLMKPLHIKEHTAQLGREEQQKYQELFVKKKINALSCSTTFEMGVDVGDLETVYLRNMPPSPANYVQRAGRAGRSVHSAAYSLTYSKLSSHDFNYFEHPENMISGKIGVPLFTISNEKVILRHIFAVALSDFFAIHPEIYDNNNADELLNIGGYEKLIEYLNSKPDILKQILKESIPVQQHEIMGINNWGWVDKLIGKNGVLNIAVTDYKETVAWYEKEIKKVKKTDLIQAGRLEQKLKDFKRSKEDGKKKNDLIEFLARNNVLPKYGFPVDTVELYENSNNNSGRLQMVRDLQIAIAEYAPDAQVVADGKLFTSRYIKTLPQSTGENWDEVYIGQCTNQSCRTMNHRIVSPSKNGEKCVSCGTVIKKLNWRLAIEPRKGFIAESLVKDIPLRKPDRSYRSEDFYIGDPSRKLMQKSTFAVNGIKFQMETSSNDSLMVVCQDHFFVCDTCGYSKSATSLVNEKGYNPHASSMSMSHKNSKGYECKCKTLLKKDLCHTFKTDVVRITFGTARAKGQSAMLSVMYALLEAASDVLSIERTDIKGCLHKVRYEKSLIYEIVLYDAVAGGAGHVRRTVTDNCEIFQKVIKRAIEITKGCNCYPSCYSCLRNYYNQSIHDKLSRIEAYNFLEEFYGSATKISDAEFECISENSNDTVNESKVKFTDGYSCDAHQTWVDMEYLLDPVLSEFVRDFDLLNISLPYEAFVTISIIGTTKSTNALLSWKNEKVLIFEDKEHKLEIEGWTSLLANEIVPVKLAEILKGGNR